MPCALGRASLPRAWSACLSGLRLVGLRWLPAPTPCGAPEAAAAAPRAARTQRAPGSRPSMGSRAPSALELRERRGPGSRPAGDRPPLGSLAAARARPSGLPAEAPREQAEHLLRAGPARPQLRTLPPCLAVRAPDPCAVMNTHAPAQTHHLPRLLAQASTRGVRPARTRACPRGRPCPGGPAAR